MAAKKKVTVEPALAAPNGARTESPTAIMTQGQQPMIFSAPPIPQIAQAPNTINVSQFAVTGAPQEIILTLGHSRVPINMATGDPAGVVKEWLMSVSLSPTSLKQLTELLKETVAGYEKRYGVIPTDTDISKGMTVAVRDGWKNMKANLPQSRKGK